MTLKNNKLIIFRSYKGDSNNAILGNISEKLTKLLTLNHKEYDDLQYMRKKLNTNTIRVDDNASTLIDYGYNYAYVHNENPGDLSGGFYFINEITYINDACVELDLIYDPLNSYSTDEIVLKSCERYYNYNNGDAEQNDTLCDLNRGVDVCYSGQMEQSVAPTSQLPFHTQDKSVIAFKSYDTVRDSTQSSGWKYTPHHTIIRNHGGGVDDGNIYMPIGLFPFGSEVDFDIALQNLKNDDNRNHNIANFQAVSLVPSDIFVPPTSPINSTDFTEESIFLDTINKEFTISIDAVTKFWNLTKIEYDNNFIEIIDNRDKTNKIQIPISELEPGANFLSLRFLNDVLNGVTHVVFNSGLRTNRKFSISYKHKTDLPFTSDSSPFTANKIQNINDQNLATNSIIGILAGAIGGAITGASGGAAGAAAGAVTGSSGSIASVATSISDRQKNIEQSGLTQSIPVNGAYACDGIFTAKIGVSAVFNTVPKPVVNAYKNFVYKNGSYFNYCGNLTGIDKTSKYVFVKSDQLFLTSDYSQKSANDAVTNQIADGVTFWNYPADIGDYKVDNSITIQ